MKDYVIVTDTCSNLEQALIEGLGIEMVSMHFTIDGKDYLADNDWNNISAKDFYNYVRSGNRIFTSQADSIQFEEVFTRNAKLGKDILVIACSGSLSSTKEEARRAKEEVQEKYPDVRIEIVDSVGACYSQGMLVLELARRKQAGASFEELYKYAEEEKLSYLEVGYADELKYLKQAGRVSAAAAFFGGIIHIKPIIIFDTLGHNIAHEKAKGKKAAQRRSAEFIKENALFEGFDTIYIAHADCEEDVLSVIEIIKETLQDDNIKFHYNYIEPAIGACVGPGTIIIDFHGKKEARLEAK